MFARVTLLAEGGWIHCELIGRLYDNLASKLFARFESLTGPFADEPGTYTNASELVCALASL